MDWIDIEERDEAIAWAEEEFLVSQGAGPNGSRVINEMLQIPDKLIFLAEEEYIEARGGLTPVNETDFDFEAKRRESRTPAEIATEHAAQDAATRSILG